MYLYVCIYIYIYIRCSLPGRATLSGLHCGCRSQLSCCIRCEMQQIVLFFFKLLCFVILFLVFYYYHYFEYIFKLTFALNGMALNGVAQLLSLPCSGPACDCFVSERHDMQRVVIPTSAHCRDCLSLLLLLLLLTLVLLL